MNTNQPVVFEVILVKVFPLMLLTKLGITLLMAIISVDVETVLPKAVKLLLLMCCVEVAVPVALSTTIPCM